MEINEIITKLRKGENFTFEEMAKRLGISTSYLNEVEKGRRKVSKKLYEKLIQNFPDNKKELEKSYLSSILPEQINVLNTYEKPKIFKFNVYGVASAGSGEIDMEHFTEEEFILPNDFKMPNGAFILEIHGDSMEPILFDGDKVIVNPNLCPANNEEWKNLNRQVAIVEIGNKRFAKKIIFKAGRMYLYSFNEDVYPEIEVKEYEEIYCVGVVSELIQRKMTKIRFWIIRRKYENRFKKAIT